MDHEMSKEETFRSWTRKELSRHEQGLINLSEWIFALALEAKIKPEDLAAAIDSPANNGFGRNLQARLQEQRKKAMEEEKEKMKATAKKFAPEGGGTNA